MVVKGNERMWANVDGCGRQWKAVEGSDILKRVVKVFKGLWKLRR